MGQCMAMGQAAGVTARIGVQNNKDIADIKVVDIQTELRKLGAVLE